MGFAASQARLISLVARKSDLEFQLQQINQRRQALSNLLSMMVFPVLMRSTNIESKEYQHAQVQDRMIQQMDKMMEMHAQRIDKQHQAVSTEMDAVNKVITNNIQKSFKLMG